MFNLSKTHCLNPFEVRGAANFLRDGVELEKISQLSIDGECDRTAQEWQESENAMQEFDKAGHISYRLLTVTPEEKNLFFRLDGDPARFGAIGHLRGDFDTGGLFYTTWFDNQTHLKTDAFKVEFDGMVNFLRGSVDEPVLKSRKDMTAYCYAHPEQHIDGTIYDTAAGFKVQTADYSYYVRCTPQKGDYDLYIFCYDNCFLLPELAGQHELPNDCFSVLPHSGELVFIVMGESGYHPQGQSTSDPDMNRQIATAKNTLLGVTRAQEEAMLAGSLFGWDTPAAKPWHYDQNGKPRLHQPKEKDHER